MFIPTNFPRSHLCNTSTPKALQTFDVHVLKQTSPKQAQLCTAGSFGAGTVCYMYVQYQAVPDTVAGSNRHSQSKINESLMKCHFHIAICFSFIGRSHFPEVSNPVWSAAWFRTRQALLHKAEGSALDVFQGGWGPGPNTLLIQLSPALFTLAKIVPAGMKKQAFQRCPSFAMACCVEAKEGHYLWMHKNIPRQQHIHQLWEGFLYQHQPFAQLSSFTACIHHTSQSSSITREY